MNPMPNPEYRKLNRRERSRTLEFLLTDVGRVPYIREAVFSCALFSGLSGVIHGLGTYFQNKQSHPPVCIEDIYKRPAGAIRNGKEKEITPKLQEDSEEVKFIEINGNYFPATPQDWVKAWDKTEKLKDTIHDKEFRDYTALDEAKIQIFLEKINSPLKDYVGYNTKEKLSKVISDASKTYKVNPLVILSTIQKEASAVEQKVSKDELETAGNFGADDIVGKKGANRFYGLDLQVWKIAKFIDDSYSGKLDEYAPKRKFANLTQRALLTYTPTDEGLLTFLRVYYRYKAHCREWKLSS